jgi:hypothetical protein
VAHAAERKLRSALIALREALDATGIPWMCIGGIAVVAQGVRRTTTDIDATLRADGIDLAALLHRFARHGIRPRIPDAVSFARRSQVLLLEHGASRVELDVSLAWLSFEHEALSARTAIDFAGVATPAARPEDLVIYKLFAARPVDLADAEALLLMHRAAIDLKRVRRVLEQLGELSGMPEVPRRLERLLAQTGAGRRATARRPRRR